jgi:hypothetical protein
MAAGLAGLREASLRLAAPPPPRQCRRFKHHADARAELDKLRTTPGAEIVGAVTPVPRKPEAVRNNFRFPAAGPYRMTP